MKVSIGGVNIPMFNPGPGNVAWYTTAGTKIHTTGYMQPVTSGTIMVTFDPLDKWDEDTTKRLAPLINLLHLLRTLKVTNNDTLTEVNDMFLLFCEKYPSRGRRTTPPKNPLLKYLKEREDKKRRWK